MSNKKINTIQDLAVRLTAVETKLATLAGLQAPGVDATSVEELNIRLTIVEKTVDELIAKPATEAVAALVAAPAGQPPAPVEEIVALSPAAAVPEAEPIDYTSTNFDPCFNASGDRPTENA